MKEHNLYDLLGDERKHLQEIGEAPEWLTTGGYQLLKEKYLDKNQTPKERFQIIAKTAAQYLPDSHIWESRFFQLFWNNWLSPSTPVLANMGTKKGLPVSCSGSVIGDSVDSFYSSLHEAAMLTKNGFGTSAYLGNIRPRGSVIASGGIAAGVLPVFEDFVIMTRKISQGSTRRGAWAGYIEADHPDVDELIHFIENNPDDANIGWIITDKFIEELDKGNQDYITRYQKIMKMKMVQGKGYFDFIDKSNALRPKMYVDKGLYVKAKQLCNEIVLMSDEEHTYSCTLSSMNLVRWDEWKDTDAVFWATVFLDCVVEDFLRNARGIPGLEKIIRFTEKSRPVGLGAMGFHSYLQKNMFPFDSVEAAMFNDEAFSHMHSESLRATQWMAKELGEPEWCVGYGVRNTHRMAVAPTKSTAILMGGWSEGINPDPAMVYTQLTSSGEVDRINPFLLEIMKDRNVYNKATIKSLVATQGSVQHVTWLSEHEKEVFKPAFEINQEVILQLASARQMYIDQGQSLNLFFGADEDEGYISYIHELAMRDPFILGLYYVYSKAGVTASKGECVSCM